MLNSYNSETRFNVGYILFSAGNRQALRELEAIGQFISFIGKPEYSDLHAFAVTVLSNCLEDVESMEVR